MSSRASVEIWHIILKFSISVPIFFDTDPLETYGVEVIPRYYYDDEYWESERSRNSLRRVCRAWNEFLKHYDHRFVRLADVLHEHVPPASLSKAIRVELPDVICSCGEFHEETHGDFTRGLVNIWEAALSEANAGSGTKATQWRLEILDGSIDFISEKIETLWMCTPNLKVMISQGVGVSRWSTANFPSLKAFLSNPTDSSHIQGFLRGIDLSSLTTLHIHSNHLDGLQDSNLHTLKHLSIDSDGTQVEVWSQESLHPLLQRIGSNLHTFYYRCEPVAVDIDPQLWQFLSSVRNVQLPYKWGSRLPWGHPLRSIQITIDDLWEADSVRPRNLHGMCEQAKDYLPPPSFGCCIIRMDTTWYCELLSGSSESGQLALWIDEYYQRSSIPFVDAHGDGLYDYIVFLTSISRKSNQRSYKLRRDMLLGF